MNLDDYPKTLPELQRHAARLGFVNPEEVAKAIASTKYSPAIITSEKAAALVREHAADRPDLVAGDAWTRWAPAELMHVRNALLRSGRAREAVEFEHKHKAPIAVADAVTRAAREKIQAERDRASAALFHAEQRIGVNAAAGLREAERVAKIRVRELERTPTATDAQIEQARQRATAAAQELATATAQAQQIRGELEQLDAAIEQVQAVMP